MSLHSKVKQYDVLVGMLFECLDKDTVRIYCHREQDRAKFNDLLGQLKNTVEDWG